MESIYYVRGFELTLMSQRATKKFTVAEFDDEYVWLELREGEKRGLQFAVPLDNSCQEELNALENGDNITATLESTNDRNTAWECIRVGKGPEGDRHSIPADD
jgi:hypothetical protein